MVNVWDVKKLLGKLYDLLDTVERQVDLPDGFKDDSLRDIFKTELHSFFMYLAASDGKINQNERDFMNELFDTNISIQNYVKFINDHSIYSTDFEKRVPITLSATVMYDLKAALIYAIKNEEYTAITPSLVKFYVEVGKAFIACDGDINPQEIEDLKTYLNNLSEAALRLSGGSSKNEDEDEDEDVGFIGGKKSSISQNKNEETQTTRSSSGNKYPESIYKVGVDIPEGKYKLFVDYGRAYYAVCSDPNCDDIVENDNFYGQAYIDIHNGQYVELRRCTAVPLDEAAMFDGTIYTSGEYLVGKEIPSGEYKLQADEGSRGYYAIETFESNGSRNIISNDNFVNAAYVRVGYGQILVLRRCTLKR